MISGAGHLLAGPTGFAHESAVLGREELPVASRAVSGEGRQGKFRSEGKMFGLSPAVPGAVPTTSLSPRVLA